jgi:hypothetical protein
MNLCSTGMTACTRVGLWKHANWTHNWNKGREYSSVCQPKFGSRKDYTNLFLNRSRYFDKCIKSNIFRKFSQVQWQCGDVDRVASLSKEDYRMGQTKLLVFQRSCRMAGTMFSVWGTPRKTQNSSYFSHEASLQIQQHTQYSTHAHVEVCECIYVDPDVIKSLTCHIRYTDSCSYLTPIFISDSWDRETKLLA